MATVYIKTLGCKVNSYDTNALTHQLKATGWDIVDSPEDADVSILNSCSVTTRADRDGRHLLRRFKRQNPDTYVVAAGCSAQTDSDILAKMDEVDLVVPNEFKQDFEPILKNYFQARDNPPASKIPFNKPTVKENRQGHFKTTLNLSPSETTRTRAFIKIQDGCNGFCSYCIIPYARGQSRSVPIEDVKKEVRRLIDHGVKEVVFTGIHIGDFGKETDGHQKDPFVRLLEDLLSWPDMIRFRVSSLEPRELSENLLKAFAIRPELFCNHFHLPLQSGNSRILKLMRRQYDHQEYADKVAMARDYFPKAFFAADVIPGFPSETEDEALETEEFIKSTGLHELHVFPYSKRPGTSAIRMPGHLSMPVIKERAARLRALSKDLKKQYLRGCIGQEADVLWENTTVDDRYQLGRTPNFVEVLAPIDRGYLAGSMTRIALKGFVSEHRLLGSPILQES